MRIISKHNDYYDSVRVYGSDPALVYLRHTKAIKPGIVFPKAYSEWGESKPLPNWIYSWKPWISCDTGTLSFCGRLYPVFRVSGETPTKHHHGEPERITEFSLTLDGVIQTVVKMLGHRDVDHNDRIKKIIRELQNTEKPAWRRNSPLLDRYHWDRWVEKNFGKQIDPSVHIALETPVFMGRSKNWTPYDVLRSPEDKLLTLVLNPVLKELGFASVVDPFTAYQELSMFVGGVLPRHGNPMIEITSDTVLRDKKGFDEWSFKQAAPGRKKARRKKNRARKAGKIVAK